MSYDPADHYWHVLATDGIWSSGRRAYVPADDATLADWLGWSGLLPTRIATEVELVDVLTAAGHRDRAPLSDAQRRALLADGIVAERARRLSAGFDFDFGDDRGIHRIGTTEADMTGWDEVTKAAQALIDTGSPAGTIGIVTDTGPATVTALEWQAMVLAATAFRQPIWAASFALQGMDPVPDDFASDEWWP